jgi:subtilisin family serine protease
METKKGNKAPVGSGMMVTALYSMTKNIGEKKSTDVDGEVTLRVSEDTIKRLYCEYVWGWGAFHKNFPVRPPSDLDLEPLSANFTDCVRRYYGQSRFDRDMGVTVGVIDTGVGPHVDLNVIGGLNTTGGPKNDYQDDDNHGTFVAGLIGSRGNRFPKLRGLAPGVRIRSYKVFDGGPDSGGDYALLKALWQAISDECDIINLSIESPEDIPEEDLWNSSLKATIADARRNGIIVVAAAGNDNRKPVDYPAAYPGVIAVSAMGCEETFPRGTIEEITIKRPPKGNKNSKEFIASFSNVGKQISATALGVGVLSTLPKNSFGCCSGTSMAAPIVAGAAACLLSRNPAIYGMKRDAARSEAIEKLLFANCVKRGFGPKYEGHGMPDPGKV